MAYIEKEAVAEIRRKIKKEFGKEWKFSVTRSDYSGVRIAIMKAPIDFIACKNFERYTEEEAEWVRKDLLSGKLDVNEFWINENWDGEARKVFLRIKKIVADVAGARYNRNADDPGADYPDYNYFLWMQVGKWDRPCEFPHKEEAEAA